MQNNFVRRPQTSKYRNESQIQFNDQNISNQFRQSATSKIPKKRPQSYRNLSKMSEFMNDTYIPIKQTKQVHYMNVIQNRDERYQIPKATVNMKNEHQVEFNNFFQKTGCKMHKPIDQFTEYTDLMRKNSSLLRRAQFNLPIQIDSYSTHKKSTNFSRALYTTSKYTQIKGGTNYKFGSSIESSLNKSIKQKKILKKEKQIFQCQTQKYINPVNKTFLGFANQYEHLLQKQRENDDKKPLTNAMNRVLTMQMMGKQIRAMTQLFI